MLTECLASALLLQVFQRRNSGQLDFFKRWRNYAEGFGDPRGEYWLGTVSSWNLGRARRLWFSCWSGSSSQYSALLGTALGTHDGVARSITVLCRLSQPFLQWPLRSIKGLPRLHLFQLRPSIYLTMLGSLYWQGDSFNLWTCISRW